MTTAETPLDTLAYSVPMAARLIGIGPRRTWDLIREGTISSFLEGGRRLVSRRALEEYVKILEAENFEIDG
jgi:excisionase family DNA binding protein